MTSLKLRAILEIGEVFYNGVREEEKLGTSIT